MANFNPLQPRFQLKINGVDVTTQVEGSVVYEESPDVISTLNFTLGVYKDSKYATRVNIIGAKDVIKLFDLVEFSGGTDDETNYRTLFKGTVKYLNFAYPDSGSVTVTVEAVDTAYKAAKDRAFYTYPSNGSKRAWADVKTLTTTQIVTNLVEKEFGLSFGTFNNQKALVIQQDITFDYKNPLTQRNETDWALLRRLAKRMNCALWSEYNSGQQQIYFVDKNVLANSTTDDISFRYLLRSANQDFTYSDLLAPNEMALRDVNVTQDLAAAYANIRVITKFDYKSGTELTTFQTTETAPDGTLRIKYYSFEVDQSKLPSDPNEREEVMKIAASLASEDESPYTIDDIKKYFKEAKFYDDRFPYVDKPWFGVTITATVDGNVWIQTKKSYKIKGIGRYGSETLTDYYYLRTLRHVWDEKGYTTELEFLL